jgi:hypothetical protein
MPHLNKRARIYRPCLILYLQPRESYFDYRFYKSHVIVWWRSVVFLSNPAGATQSNLEGIAHVISRMEWYCALAEHLLNKKNIMIGNESFEGVWVQLEKAVITLYKALLLY